MTITLSPAAVPAAPTANPAEGTAWPAILVVDDSPLDRRIAERLLTELGGWTVRFATNGVEALAALAEETPQVVLTDLQMPQMDGLALVERVREQSPQVPVILMTRRGSEEIAVEALRAGAASYVPKRNLRSQLAPTLEQVMSASRVNHCRQRMLGCLTERHSRVTLESDPALVGPLVAHLQEDILAVGLCGAGGVTRVGIALEEALLNSICHGNLEVSSELRRQGDDAFERLVAARRQSSPYRERRVRLYATVKAAGAVYVLIDEGRGFDPARLPSPTDPGNLDKPSGRGVLLMRTFMDRVTYNAGGCQVTLVKKRERK
jgi:CheY-like chemotaxis protein/anti-sigma regulatory factor (Ser/Thr protein kinase)